MSLSVFIVRSLKKIQGKSVQERKKIQVFVVATCLILLLILGIISLKSEFTKSENPFSAVNETNQGRQLKGLFEKIRGLAGEIKEGVITLKGTKQ
ncbi:MAG: hypothetical protein U9Q72_01370 [Patescibacteria group bacterium]|nr:hypothetical protein [Patescibacteria group bacterium]